MKDIQKKIDETYSRVFSNTPQSERFSDIQNQFFKLMRNTGVKGMKESTGDLLASLIQLCNESDWDLTDLIKQILEKKNHDYGESWRKMRVSSIVDESLVKVYRIVEMEKMMKKDSKKIQKLNPKILDSLYDITNYLIFALIHIKEGKNPMQ